MVSNPVLHFVNMSKRLVAFSRQHFWYIPRAGISWSRFFIIESQFEVSQPDDEVKDDSSTVLSISFSTDTVYSSSSNLPSHPWSDNLIVMYSFSFLYFYRCNNVSELKLRKR